MKREKPALTEKEQADFDKFLAEFKEKMGRDFTMADHARGRFYRRIFASFDMLRPSIADRLRHAKSEKEIHDNLMRALVEVPASAATKRKWKRMADARLSELRSAIVVAA